MKRLQIGYRATLAALVSLIVVTLLIGNVAWDGVRSFFSWATGGSYRVRLYVPVWELLLPSTWRLILEDHMRCAVSPFQVTGIYDRPACLPPYSFYDGARNIVCCWHEDEAVLVNIQHGGSVKRVKLRTELFGDRYPNTARRKQLT